METTPNQNFLEQVSKDIGQSHAVFGAPVEGHGYTVIPVSTTRYMIGGGGGGRQQAEQGSGGGVAVKTKPVGYIEISDEHVAFKRAEPAAIGVLRIMLGVGATLWLTLHALSPLLTMSKGPLARAVRRRGVRSLLRAAS